MTMSDETEYGQCALFMSTVCSFAYRSAGPGTYLQCRQHYARMLQIDDGGLIAVPTARETVQLLDVGRWRKKKRLMKIKFNLPVR